MRATSAGGLGNSPGFRSGSILNRSILRKTAFLSHLYIKRPFCQDRLGTNIGKTQKKMPFSAPRLHRDKVTTRFLRSKVPVVPHVLAIRWDVAVVDFEDVMVVTHPEKKRNGQRISQDFTHLCCDLGSVWAKPF
jgi:hypothetical protein